MYRSLHGSFPWSIQGQSLASSSNNRATPECAGPHALDAATKPVHPRLQKPGTMKIKHHNLTTCICACSNHCGPTVSHSWLSLLRFYCTLQTPAMFWLIDVLTSWQQSCHQEWKEPWAQKVLIPLVFLVLVTLKVISERAEWGWGLKTSKMLEGDLAPSHEHNRHCSSINPSLLYYFQIIFKWAKPLWGIETLPNLPPPHLPTLLW